MAETGVVRTYLAGLEDNIQRALGGVFDYVMRDIRFGRAGDAEACTNMGGGLFKGETPSVANTEFTVAHNFGRTPYLLIPVMPGTVVGAKIVRLENARAWDATRIYLKSPDTSSTFYFYLEG